jgi:hypothetical protein
MERSRYLKSWMIEARLRGPHMLSTDDYESALYSVLIPSTLNATSTSPLKPNKGGIWSYASARDLRHEYWNLRTADPDKDRKADRFLWLGDSLDFRFGWTNGITPLHDALSMRIACIEILKGNGTAQGVSAAQTVKIVRNLEWVIRWRNALGIRRFQDLSPDHYRQFIDDASTSDITDLLPLIDRLDILLEHPSYKLPLYRHGKRYRMDWHVFATTLGLHRWSIGHSKTFKTALIKRLPLFLEKSSVASGMVDLYPRSREGRPSEESNPFHRLSAWDALEILSIKGLLSHDALTFQPS